MTDYGKHDFNYTYDWYWRCKACGVRPEDVEDGLASEWCDKFVPPARAVLALWVHWVAIVLLVGAPLYGFIAPHTGVVQFLVAFLVSMFALWVAQVHAGVWDRVAEMLRDA